MQSTVHSGLTEVVTICENRFNQNCFLLLNPAAQMCIVVDPGFGYSAIAAEIRQRELSVSAIVATHTHFDHIASVAQLQREFHEPPFFAHPAEQPLLAKANVFALLLRTDPIEPPLNLFALNDGATLDLGALTLRAHHAPGHTAGSVVLEHRNLLFCGDLLLEVPAALKRLPGADDELLARSRQQVLQGFPGDTRVLPGHGRPKTIAELRARYGQDGV